MFITIFIIVLIICLIRLNIKHTYIYKDNSYVNISGLITKISINDGYNLIINGKDKVIVYTDIKNNYELGDKVLVKGIIKKTDDYLKNKDIYYSINSYNIKIIKKNNNLFYKIKNNIYSYISNNRYLLTFILGDKSLIDKDVKSSFQSNGISHLFSISGMHIALFSTILEKIFRIRFREEDSFKITSVILLFYLLLIGFLPSVLRGVLFYILFRLNSIYYFYVKGENIFLFILSLALLINPKYVYDVGFWYSYLISFSLIRCSNYLTGNYIISLLKVSILSFIVSIPITIYNFYEVNILGIIYNLFYVPFVSLVLFPFSLLVFIFRFLEPIYNILIIILEKSSLFINNIDIGKFVFKEVFIGIYILYLLLIILYLMFRKRIIIIIYFFILFIHLLLPYFDRNNYVEYIDVGQGDSILIHLENKNILLDTGENEIKNKIKSRGIRHINYLILSHGDKDHMGESINIIKNFKVDKVIFNCGEYNYLEKDLIKELNNRNINYYKCINELNINNRQLYFLNNNVYDNENDNSNVIYMEINNYKFLFMGDASIKREKDILDEYDISDIDVLKIGHHGSKYSSSEYFIKSINPKYSIISVGKNNRFGHPTKEVLNNLRNSKIYRTDRDGSIMFRIKNNKMYIS